MIAIKIIIVILVVAIVAYLLFPQSNSIENDPEFTSIKAVLGSNGYSFKSISELNPTIETKKEPLEKIVSKLDELAFSGDNAEKIVGVRNYFLELAKHRVNEIELFQKIDLLTDDLEIICNFPVDIIDLDAEYTILGARIAGLNRIVRNVVRNKEVQFLPK